MHICRYSTLSRGRLFSYLTTGNLYPGANVLLRNRFDVNVCVCLTQEEFVESQSLSVSLALEIERTPSPNIREITNAIEFVIGLLDYRDKNEYPNANVDSSGDRTQRVEGNDKSNDRYYITTTLIEKKRYYITAHYRSCLWQEI